MVLTVSQTKFYHNPEETKQQKHLVWKENSTFKNFHFESKILISRQNAFLQEEIAQILKL